MKVTRFIVLISVLAALSPAGMAATTGIGGSSNWATDSYIAEFTPGQMTLSEFVERRGLGLTADIIVIAAQDLDQLVAEFVDLLLITANVYKHGPNNF